jgi:hypothetical protein
LDRINAMVRPTTCNEFAELADTAAREKMSYLGFLAEQPLLAECDERARRSGGRRHGHAAMPPAGAGVGSGLNLHGTGIGTAVAANKVVSGDARWSGVLAMRPDRYGPELCDTCIPFE